MRFGSRLSCACVLSLSAVVAGCGTSRSVPVPDQARATIAQFARADGEVQALRGDATLRKAAAAYVAAVRAGGHGLAMTPAGAAAVRARIDGDRAGSLAAYHDTSHFAWNTARSTISGLQVVGHSPWTLDVTAYVSERWHIASGLARDDPYHFSGAGDSYLFRFERRAGGPWLLTGLVHQGSPV